MMIQIIHDLMLSGLGKYSSFILQDKDDYYRVSTEAREASAIIVKAAKAKIHWANNIAIITKTD